MNGGPPDREIGASSTVRKGDWKLIYYHLDQRFELFNLTDDIGEDLNLADTDPEQLGEMANLLGSYLRESRAQMPSNRHTGEVIPYPDELVN